MSRIRPLPAANFMCLKLLVLVTAGLVIGELLCPATWMKHKLIQQAAIKKKLRSVRATVSELRCM